MKFSIISLLNVITLISGEYSSYSQFTGDSLAHHHKHSQDQTSEIPSLKSLFNYTTYRDRLNKTSPCLFTGHKRDTHCQMVSFFDEDGYERSLQETRNLILNRLNLDSEPETRINKNTLSFLDQLENKILKDKQETVLESSYDGPSSSKKVFNSIHEAVHMSTRCGHGSKFSSRSSSHLCITFDVPAENLMSSNGLIRRPTGAHLWLFIRTQASYESGIDDNFHLEISNDHALSNSEIIYNLRYGWKKINISKVFKVGHVGELTKDSVLKYTIKLKCFYDCSIGFTHRDMDTFFYEDTTNILISSFPGKKPLMSIDIEEESEMDKKRSKRRIATAEGERNYRSASHSGHITRTCRPSAGNKDRECCLNQYQVDFDRLKWSSWIISPHSYSANFCSGGCNDPRSFNYGGTGVNSELKMRYNEQSKSRLNFEPSQLFETCCHPISMESLTITYVSGNNTLIRAVIPNMIVTGCGCS